MISAVEQSRDVYSHTKEKKWFSSQQDWTVSCFNKQKYLKNKIATNKDSVSKEHIQKENHRANAGCTYLSTVQKKGVLGCQCVLAKEDGRPSRAWGWMHGDKNQKIQQISGPISSKLLTLKWMHQNVFSWFFLKFSLSNTTSSSSYFSILSYLLIHIRSVWRDKISWYTKSNFPICVTMLFLPFLFGPYRSAFCMCLGTVGKQGLWWENVEGEWQFDLLKIVFGGSSPILPICLHNNLYCSRIYCGSLSPITDDENLSAEKHL